MNDSFLLSTAVFLQPDLDATTDMSALIWFLSNDALGIKQAVD